MGNSYLLILKLCLLNSFQIAPLESAVIASICTTTEAWCKKGADTKMHKIISNYTYTMDSTNNNPLEELSDELLSEIIKNLVNAMFRVN